MDYRRMYDDKEMLYSYDLEEFGGQDAVFQIKAVKPGELTGQKGRKTKKPFIEFHDPDNRLHGKKLAANKTNGKSIAKMYGKDATKWVGQWIAMYCTTVDYDGETTDCIRVRPNRPDVQRPAQNGKSTRKVDVDSMIAAFGGCDEQEMFDALESDRKAAWQSISKDDKLRVKAAAEAAAARVRVAAADAKENTPEHDDGEPSADEQAEIAAQEAQQS